MNHPSKRTASRSSAASMAYFAVLACGSVAHAQASADRVDVRLLVDGRAFAGQLTAEPMPATQPATVPADDIPTVEITGGDAPFAVHLTGSESLDPTTLRDTRIRWDFGDPAGRFNQIDGYNAAHVFDAAGTYAITRTIESPAGTSRVRVMLEVKPAARSVVYVSADGNDAADGSSPERAFKTWSRAVGTLGSNVEVRFRRGDTFTLDRAVVVRGDNVRLTSYGDAEKQRPMLVVERQLLGHFTFEVSGKRFAVDGLAFDANYFGNDLGKANLPDLFHPSGTGGMVIRDCAFHNVNTVVNGNAQPKGVLLLDNELPLETGLRSYFAWVEGSNWTILGNRVANSTREHIVRVGGNGGERVNIQFNDFNNLDRREIANNPDKSDTAKAALNIQKGRTLYAAHNWLRGANGVGPLGGADGKADKAGRWVGAVVEYNRVDGFLEVNHGLSFATYRNNVLRIDDSIAFPVGGFDQSYGRGVSDIWIERNVVINAGKTGKFLAVQAGATNLRVNGNVFIAPNLVTGAYESAAIFTREPDLRAFAEIGGNVWPTARPNPWAQNGIHYVAASWGEQAGYRDAAEWNAMRPPVNGDRFENLTDLSVVEFAGAGVADAARLPATKP